MPIGYVRERFYRDKKVALREAKRLRETRKYNAKVLPTNIPDHLPWTLWTKRISDRP